MQERSNPCCTSMDEYGRSPNQPNHIHQQGELLTPFTWLFCCFLLMFPTFLCWLLCATEEDRIFLPPNTHHPPPKPNHTMFLDPTQQGGLLTSTYLAVLLLPASCVSWLAAPWDHLPPPVAAAAAAALS
jgi:hypothetical protein